MRYVVDENEHWWAIKDRTDEMAPVAFLSKARMPDAEKMAKDQCLFLNESPAMKAA